MKYKNLSKVIAVVLNITLLISSAPFIAFGMSMGTTPGSTDSSNEQSTESSESANGSSGNTTNVTVNVDTDSIVDGLDEISSEIGELQKGNDDTIKSLDDLNKKVGEMYDFVKDALSQKIPITAYSLNNTNAYVDLQQSSDDFDAIWLHCRKVSSDREDLTFDVADIPQSQVFTKNDLATSEDLKYYTIAKSYLIQNGILERPSNVMIDTTDGSVSDVSRLNGSESWLDANDPVTKSDLYTMLYKSVYGIIPSRSLDCAYTTTTDVETEVDSTEEDTEMDSTVTETVITSETHGIYTEGNVYELYLKSLVEKGIVQLSELKYFNDSDLSSDSVSWLNTNKRFGVDRTYDKSADMSKIKGNEFGKSFVIEQKDDFITITPKKPKYFKTGDVKSMQLIDVLNCAVKFMRATEKDMTDTEAKIVAYKYGIDYLGELTDEEYNTVAFLIAKGILNFEDYNDIGFFCDATWEDVIPIVYRVANKDARYNFSEIQLTDGEAFWQAKGFSKEDFTLLFPNGNYKYETESVVTNESAPVDLDHSDTETASLSNSIKSVFKQVNAAGTGVLYTYTVTKVVDTTNLYYYKGTKLDSDLCQKVTASNSPFTELTSMKLSDDGKSYTLTFSILSSSLERAAQIVDDNFKVTMLSATSYKLSGVTRIEDSNGNEIRLISKSVIQKCFGSTIDFVYDKVLVNAKTGAMACILPESGYALVGNQVFADEELLVTTSDNEVFYNLEIIASLLGLSITTYYQSSVDSQKVAESLAYDVCNIEDLSDSVTSAAEYIAVNAVTENGTVCSILDTSNTTPQGAFDAQATKGTLSYFSNINQITNGINTMLRTFNYTEGNSVYKITIIADWIYLVPSMDDFADNSLLTVDSLSSGQVTWSDVFESIYAAPESGSPLRALWDSNMAMSQGITNLMFGKSNTEFIKSGYLMPCLTVLVPEELRSRANTSDMSDILVKLGFTVSSKYSQFFNGSTNKFLDSYFGSKHYGLSGASSGFQTIQALVDTHRTCNIIVSTEDDDYGGEFFTDLFYRDSNSVVYRNLARDPFNRFVIHKGSDGKLNSVSVLDEIASDSDVSISNNTVVTRSFGSSDYTFMYLGTTNLLDGNGKAVSFDTLVPVYSSNKKAEAELPHFSYGGDFITLRTNSKNYTVYKNYLIDTFYTKFGITESDVASNSALTLAINNPSIIFEPVSTEALISKYTKSVGSGRIYVGFNSSGNCIGYEAEYGDTSWSQVNNNDLAFYSNSSGLLAIPKIFVPTGMFTYKLNSKNNWIMKKGSTTGYVLNQSHISYSGIVDGIIDSIIAASLETTNVDKLTDGTILVIGRVKWIKQGDYWYSYPIKKAGLAKTLKKKPDEAKAVFSQLYSSLPIQCDGKLAPLENYVTSCTISSLFAEKASTGTTVLTLDSGGSPVVYKKTKSGIKETNDSPEAFVLKAKFDSGLLVRPITSNHSVYKVCSNASEYVITGSSVAYFSESLNYDSVNAVNFSLSQTGFEETSTFSQVSADFTNDFKEQFSMDLQHWLGLLIYLVTIYFILISWIIYLSVTRGAGFWLLNAIAGKKQRDGSRHGVDLVKILSFGIYSIDNPPIFTRMFISTLICILIDVICILIL